MNGNILLPMVDWNEWEYGIAQFSSHESVKVSNCDKAPKLFKSNLYCEPDSNCEVLQFESALSRAQPGSEAECLDKFLKSLLYDPGSNPSSSAVLSNLLVFSSKEISEHFKGKS